MSSFTHVDGDNRPTMVDVSDKAVTARTAVAETRVRLPAAVREKLSAAGFATAKGPVFHTAIIAGTMAAKRTHELIPFCHPLGLEKCRVEIEPVGDDLVVRCTVGVTHKTGVEMEALTGASVAALTIYDMCKALSHDIVIADTRLVAKTGGKSDFGSQPAPLAGLVLAGGKSRRMATDKAALNYAGETQLARVHRLLSAVVDEVYVSVQPDQVSDDIRRRYRQIVDRDADLGPAAGIAAALAARPERAFLVVAVDLPFLTESTLKDLIRQRDATGHATAYASAHDGLPEPLCAIWEPAAAAELAAALGRGERCPRKFLGKARTRLIPLAAPGALDNINTPDEYAEASRALGTGAGM
jgi:cyclic pyranopterin monophosphate synthase